MHRLLESWRRKRVSAPLSLQFPQFDIGVASYGDLSVVPFDESTTLKVGSYCSFARGVCILLGGNHRVDWVTTFPFSAVDPRFCEYLGHPSSRGDVTIGNDVWIGRDALILSGVTVGDGAVVGARAVVARDVAPYMIVAGNPARDVRLRFPKPIIERLLALSWWNWSEDRIAGAMRYLLSDDIDAFLSAAERGEI